MRPAIVLTTALSLAGVALAACDDGDAPATRAAFELASPHDSPATFYDLPFPSDLRLTATGAPDLTGFYSKGPGTIGDKLRLAAMDRPGFPQLPVAYVRFDGALTPRHERDLIPATADAPMLLVDIDDDSPARGTLYPLVARTLSPDDFAPAHLLAVAPRPGIVLDGATTYALVVRRGALDAAGAPLGVPDALAELAAGAVPEAGGAAAALYAPMWPVLDQLGVPRTEVAAATVFTTGDVVADFAALSDALIARHAATLANPVLDAVDGVHPDYCELKLDLSVPQFLTGEEPWNDGGGFALGDDGLPVVQGVRTIPAVVTVPRAAMPADGFPLMLYFHGSGGVYDQVVDASRSLPDDEDGVPGEGPAMYYARIGFAAAGAALPVSPDRVPGASDIAYINVNNLGAFPYLFRQGVLEQRMFLSALAELELDPAVLGGCDGVTLPDGAAIRFDPAQLYAGGQSMGGMYTNLFGAIDPRPRALVPTGAGGHWSLMILVSSLFRAQAGGLGVILGTPEELSFLHPAMHSLAIAWEPAEPMVYMPRLSRKPLPGRAARPVYQPVGKDDGYFAPTLYDAVALAYGHPEAGSIVWPTMQDALALAGLDGVIGYPVRDNLISADGTPYTAAVVQYEGDGVADPHAIYRQRDEVVYQYGCFLDSVRRTGHAVIAAPAALGTPCP